MPKADETENETIAQARSRLKWEQDDYICKEHIYNARIDTRFNMYNNKSPNKSGMR